MKALWYPRRIRGLPHDMHNNSANPAKKLFNQISYNELFKSLLNQPS